MYKPKFCRRKNRSTLKLTSEKATIFMLNKYSITLNFPANARYFTTKLIMKETTLV